MAEGGTTVATWYGNPYGAGTDGMYVCVREREGERKAKTIIGLGLN